MSVLARPRARRGERAALESSLDDPAFEPARVRTDVRTMLELAASVWHGPDAAELKTRAEARCCGRGR